MLTFIGTVLVGILFIVLGIVNLTGNISTLHSYHRNRVRKEDEKPLGVRVGIGMLILSVAIIAFGVLTFLAEQTGQERLGAIATGVMLGGIVIALPIILLAVKKYNHGIF